MKLIYGVSDKPTIGKTLVFAFQQMIAIMAATLLVPLLMSGFATGVPGETLSFDPAAALFGAGCGSIVYILFTKRRSPVFLGSSFTFLGAYAAVIGHNYGYWGVLIGIAFAGLVYVVIAIIIKLVGSNWINKLMPAVIIGPIVAIIGLSLSGTATGWMSGNGGAAANWYTELVYIAIGLITFLVIAWASTKGTKGMKLIPFIIGIGAGYLVALILSIIGWSADVEALKIIDFNLFKNWANNFGFTSILDYPKFTFLKAIELGDAATQHIDGAAIGNIALTFIPIGIVELAQHIADHKNLSSIIEKDLITDPGLDKTLLGDGVGSIVGGFFGGAANTTYGESIGCVAITKNASIYSILFAAIGCIVLSFFTPFVLLINSIPKCVMGGACIAMYGFIAVSGLQMLKQVDLSDSRNLYVVASILVVGIGGLTLNFGNHEGSPIITFTSLATALFIGLITNLLVHKIPSLDKEGEQEKVEDAPSASEAQMADENHEEDEE